MRSNPLGAENVAEEQNAVVQPPTLTAPPMMMAPTNNYRQPEVLNIGERLRY